MDYRKEKHSKSSLRVHLIFVCKYRKPLLTNSEIDEFIKKTIVDASDLYNCSIIEMESDKDHIHILIEYPTTLSMSELVRRIKLITTNRVWKKFSLLSRFIRKRRLFGVMVILLVQSEKLQKILLSNIYNHGGNSSPHLNIRGFLTKF